MTIAIIQYQLHPYDTWLNFAIHKPENTGISVIIQPFEDDVPQSVCIILVTENDGVNIMILLSLSWLDCTISSNIPNISSHIVHPTFNTHKIPLNQHQSPRGQNIISLISRQIHIENRQWDNCQLYHSTYQ